MNGFRDLTKGESQRERERERKEVPVGGFRRSSLDRLSLFVYLTMCITWILLYLTAIVKIRLIKRMRKIRNFFPAEEQTSVPKSSWTRNRSLHYQQKFFLPSARRIERENMKSLNTFRRNIQWENDWKGSISHFHKFRRISNSLASICLFSTKPHNLKRKRSKNFYNASLLHFFWFVFPCINSSFPIYHSK